jgi:GTP cyclohydrolase II
MTMQVKFSDTAKLPTKYGEFQIIAFNEEGNSHEHAIVFQGDLAGKEAILTRIHSECLTSDVFTSLKCDCGEQLEESLRLIAEKKEGAVIYLRQEGRGIGLFNKINAYALQDQGQNTIEANHSLGFETDLRKFDIAVKALEHLHVKSIVLLSNNPDKISLLQDSGILVTRVQPLIIKPNKFNIGYLTVKKDELNHLL